MHFYLSNSASPFFRIQKAKITYMLFFRYFRSINKTKIINTSSFLFSFKLYLNFDCLIKLGLKTIALIVIKVVSLIMIPIQDRFMDISNKKSLLIYFNFIKPTVNL